MFCLQLPQILLIIVILIKLFFTIKSTNLCVTVETLLRDNHKLSKLLSKEFERSVYWNEYEKRSDNKNTINRYLDIFSNQIVLESKDYLLLFT